MPDKLYPLRPVAWIPAQPGWFAATVGADGKLEKEPVIGWTIYSNEMGDREVSPIVYEPGRNWLFGHVPGYVLCEPSGRIRTVEVGSGAMSFANEEEAIAYCKRAIADELPVRVINRDFKVVKGDDTESHESV
jgi:hypothetical protein